MAYRPNYQISNKIINDLTEIAEIKAIIERAPILPRDEARLRRQALVRMVHASVSIEGNRLNAYEVNKVIEGQKVDAAEREIHEVKNYQTALNFISQWVEAKKSLNLHLILKVQELVTRSTLPPEKSGHFRKNDVYVANISKIPHKKDKEEILYVAPKAEQVPGLLKDLIEWVANADKNRVSPVIIAGIFHYQFVTIHPFTDGNGRTARILATLILYERGYDFRKLFSLEQYYNEHRKEYYLALSTGKNYQVRIGVNITSWLEYFTKGFVEEMRQIKQKLMAVSFNRVAQPAEEQVYLTSEKIKIMDYATTMGSITSDEVTDITGAAKRTAQLHLQDLVRKGLLRRIGKGPSSRYVIASQLRP